MKKNIHPKYNTNVKVTCSCGNTFVTGSVLTEIRTELCSNCHPFFTGEQKIVDSANLVSKYEKLVAKSKGMSFKTKKQKMLARKEKFQKADAIRPSLTLKDMLSKISK
ncbi:MAG TPA: 50S ribosomal protein L31 [Candidatus Dojkabacteria bacterium]|nr:50S ribosomal protein L31 [Candidatus Dojkabacteria bacterium]